MGHLKCGSPGSSVLLTTCSRKVAEAVDSTCAYDLPFLSDEDSWNVFQQCFGIAMKCLDPEFQQIGIEIVKKCGGVPLVKVIAGVLHGMKTIEEWQSIRDRNVVDVEDDEHRVFSCLWLSYFHLPHHLKYCFVHCSLFPRGHLINRRHLIAQWIAHGFVRANQAQEPEDIGIGYFDSLLKVGLLQDQHQWSLSGDVTCKMHDLVHDLARQILQDEFGSDIETADQIKWCRYLSLVSCTGKLDNKIFDKVRALYISGRSLAFDKTMNKQCCVRTIILKHISVASLNIFISKFKHLGAMAPSSLALAPTETELPAATTARSAGPPPFPSNPTGSRPDPPLRNPPAPPARPPVSPFLLPPPPAARQTRPSVVPASHPQANPRPTKRVRFALTANITPPHSYSPSPVSRDESTRHDVSLAPAPPGSSDRIEDEDTEGWTTIWRRRGRAARAEPAYMDVAPRSSPIQVPSRLLVSLRGKCARCLSKGHFAIDCRDPVKCIICKRSGHRSWQCFRRDSKPSPASRCQPPRLDTHNFPPLVAPPMARPGDPAERPGQSFAVASSTRDMDRELERLSSHAVVVWLGRDRPDVSIDRVERAFCSRFSVRPEDVTVTRSPPADFLVTFTHRHHREAAVAARDFPHGNLDFRIRPWQLITLGDRHDLSYHVRLCLEGIPPHAWNESIAKRSVARACVLDYVEENCLSPNKVDARCLNLWAWTENPSDIPKVVWLTITGRTMVIHDDAPPPTGQCGLTFRVLVHIDLVEGPPGCDGLPATRSLPWHHGVIDGEREPRDRLDPPPTAHCSDRRRWDREDEDDGDDRRGRRRREKRSWSSQLFRSLSRAPRDRDRSEPRLRELTLNWSALAVAHHDLSSLEAPFSLEELKETIFSMPSDKAPGPDGFTGIFFKECWDIIKYDVLEAFHQLHNMNGRDFKFLNSANIVLIPKKPDAMMIGDYRPISLIHSIAKIFSKLLANRLVPFLDSLISKSQSAFIRKRCIQDNFLYVQNIVRRLHKQRKPALFLKLDIQKAFDTVNWGYLLEVLQTMGFGPRWREWISILFGSATSRALLNGRQGTTIQHMRGVRQGDPLSPMLFILAIDPLQRILDLATRHGILSPLPLTAAKLRTSLYADDAAIFINPFKEEFLAVKNILHAFGCASGLFTNFEKSSIHSIRCEGIDLDHVLQPFQGTRGTFPCRYLGLQLHTRPLQKIHVQPLIEKISNRLAGWKGNLLNRAGRLTFVSSVLSSMPTYHLSVFPLAVWARKRIDKIRRSFLWKGKAESNGGHCLVAWPLVSKPKALGGLGVLNLDKFSRALRLRWLWKDWMGEDHPWKGLDVPCNHVDRLLFSASTTVTIGNGTSAKFWHDSWLDGMAPRNLAPHLFELVSRKNKSLQPDLPDSIAWKWTPDGIFTVSSAYKAQFLGSYSHIKANFVWRARAEPKCKIFAWILLQDKLLTANNLAARGWPHQPSCSLCNGPLETGLHLGLHCPFARAVWDQILAWEEMTLPAQADIASSSSIKNWWEAASSLLPKNQKRDFNGIVIYTLWNLWKERNRRIFESNTLTPLQIALRIKEDVLVFRRALFPCNRVVVAAASP
ncbi:hypothetical protein U9M48_037717 [Paspalum notatum var. saurae]|uniref:Reverse transcriptase domain-containing protein n=1 Tax=Paspalum notatum var. saurae TaxID=547442 RepID=A0AAQ3UJS3_PASNO